MTAVEIIADQCKQFAQRALWTACPNLLVLTRIQRVLYEKRQFQLTNYGQSEPVPRTGILPPGSITFPLENAIDVLRRSSFFVEGVARAVTEEDIDYIMGTPEEAVIADFYAKYPFPPLSERIGVFEPAAVRDFVISLQGKLGHLGKKDSPLRLYLESVLSPDAHAADSLIAIFTLSVFHDVQQGYVRHRNTFFRCSTVDLLAFGEEREDPEMVVAHLKGIGALLAKGDITL
jgi:hypothetical protein